MIDFILFMGGGLVLLLVDLLIGAHFHEPITAAWDTSVAWIRLRLAKK